MDVRGISTTIIFLAAIAAGGCTPRAQSTVVSDISTPAVTNVGRRTLPPSLVMGEQSCASSGCHGKASDGTFRDWRTAYSVWLGGDPHRGAFAVLYTERSIEIFRNFHPESKLSAEPPADNVYEAFLGERCLGCHATGLRGRGVVPLTEGRDRPAFYLAGVTCESCHGPASGWLDTHYLAGFSRNTTGFHDTKPLSSRAAACVGCHVGPMVAANGKAYDMNHDFVAAGHPRLAFEFSAYLANLPKHWDEAKDMVGHQSLAAPMTFHSDAWAAGQEQVARQLVRQIEHRLAAAKRDPNEHPWPDFSNFDCFDCHHSIGPPVNERSTSAQLAGRHNFPRPAIMPLDALRIMSGRAPPEENPAVAQAAGLVEMVLTSSWQMPLVKVEQPEAAELAIFTDRGGPALITMAPENRWQQQSRWLLTQMQSWKRFDPDDPRKHRWVSTWDEAVHLYLGVRALAQDVERESPGPLIDAATRLGTSLGQDSFRSLSRSATQYDSPTDFDRTAWQLDLDKLEQVLKALTQTNPAPSNP